MRPDDFGAWLTRYGDAWEARDAEAIAALFAPGALFEAQPFAMALRDKPAIRDHWRARFAGQRDPSFSAEVLGVGVTYGVAHWRATYRPTAEPPPTAEPSLAIDGVLMAAFDPVGRCTSLRQWWHEGDAGRP